MPLTDPISFQLYSARNFPPLEAQLGVARRGRLYAMSSLTAPSTRTSRAPAAAQAPRSDGAQRAFRARPAREDARQGSRYRRHALGMDIVVVPYLGARRPADGRRRLGGVRPAPRQGRRAGPGEGLRFAWHNHDFEFKVLADGSYPIEHVLVDGRPLGGRHRLDRAAPTPIRAPGSKRYAGKVPLVHVKDIAKAGRRPTRMAGPMSAPACCRWQEFWDLGVAAGAEAMIAEHDNPSDLERFAHAERRGDARLRPKEGQS